MNELSKHKNISEIEKNNNVGYILITFAKNKSINYEAAVNIAKTSSRYAESELESTLVHAAAFKIDGSDLNQASSLLKLVNGIKSTKVFINGDEIEEIYTISSVLSCIKMSSLCNDHKAHCVVIFPQESLRKVFSNVNLGNKGDERVFYPCSFLASNTGMKLNVLHPASLEDQIQAFAVEKGCYWCPNFDIKSFKYIE
ncbi:hypothetical protein JOS77_29165 [Chromobacterium haemolyticum]|nr:hypothetical protein JOS77_29165 [Chromobacterium haemolyticum]